MQAIGGHPLHFADITGVNLGLGNVTPPSAPVLYLDGRIGNCSIDKYIKPTLILIWGDTPSSDCDHLLARPVPNPTQVGRLCILILLLEDNLEVRIYL
jgi:hypothetical protein